MVVIRVLLTSVHANSKLIKVDMDCYMKVLFHIFDRDTTLILEDIKMAESLIIMILYNIKYLDLYCPLK